MQAFLIFCQEADACSVPAAFWKTTANLPKEKRLTGPERANMLASGRGGVVVESMPWRHSGAGPDRKQCGLGRPSEAAGRYDRDAPELLESGRVSHL